jgi:NB-ARC domain/APAF-1 helical domain
MQQDNRDNATGFQTTVEGGVAYIGTNHIYNSSRRTRGIPFQALALPKDYVDRPEIRQQIKSKLIDRSSVSRPGTLVVSAIYGLGGVGKSVMAAALAHDREVQEVCADGVLWVTLGQNPDLLPCLYGWVQALGDYDFNPTTIDSASSHLRSLVRDKKMLLVVDDAWQIDHVEPFQVGGEGCRVLVTTREAHVQDADRIDLDVMSEAESLELLLSKAQVKSLTVEEDRQARKLIAVVGGLPLAVDLAGAQIADGMSWNELLEDLEAEIAYLESLDRPNAEGVRDEKNRKRLSLKASLNLSLKLLSNEQLQQFAWLGVLPEDVTIQPEMAATLWSIPRKKAGAVLRTFRAKALLLSGVQGLGQESSYRIHDLMHDLARGLLTGKGEADIPGLDLKWLDAHGILLDRYRQQATDNLWHTLPDDSYIYSYLTWHLEKAGRLNELHGLFQEVTAKGRNAWYERCDFLGKNAKFVTDLGRAWKLAEEMYEENASQSIGFQIRYSLVFSTLNSLSSNIPAELMAALVKNKKWSPSQVLAYAKQAQESSKRAEIVYELATFLPPLLFSEALEVARSIPNDSARAYALSGLVPHLPDIISEALEVVRSIPNKFNRASALSGLVPHLPDIISEALEVARSIPNEFNRASALISLAPHLLENLLSEALEVARNIQDDAARASVLSGLVPHLPDIVLEALEIARSIQNEYDRASVMIALVPHLPENLLSEALEVARNIQDEFNRARVLSELVPHLPDIVSEALEVARSIQDEFSRASVLSGLVPHLPDIVSEALEVARSIQDEFSRASMLSRLVPHLSDIVSEALDVARSLQDDSARASALIGILPHLPDIVSEALDVARSLQDDSARASVLISLVPHLSENLFSEALDVARSIQNEFKRASALINLMPHLPENLFLEALNLACLTQNKYYRASALISLVPHLPENLLSGALDVARDIQDDSERARLLIGLVPHLPDIIPEALEVARSIQDDSERARLLIGLVPHLPDNLLSGALDVARGIQDDSERARLLIGLVPHLPDIISEALEVARGIQDNSARAYVLIGLVPHLPDIISEALEVARGIQDNSARARLLIALVPHLPDIVSEALDVARGIQDDSARARLLIALVPHLPENLLSAALEVARGVQDDSERTRLLIALVPHIPDIIPEALDVAFNIQGEYYRTSALITLAPLLPENLLSEALDVAFNIQNDSARASVLSGLVSQVDLKSFNFPFWSEVLHTLAHRDRKHLLEDIPKLAPAIIHLSDRSTLNLVVQAMREVCQQWP